MKIDTIRAIMVAGQYRYSDHAVKQMIKRNISRMEIEEATAVGAIIEEYPDDKYSPSCLVFGKTGAGRILHVQLSLPPSVVVITAYEPDAAEWVDFRLRRRKP